LQSALTLEQEFTIQRQFAEYLENVFALSFRKQIFPPGMPMGLGVVAERKKHT